MSTLQSHRLLVSVLFACMLAGCGTPRNGPPRLSSAEAERLVMRAERAIAQGDLAKAVADYVTVVNAQPDNATAWYRLGTVYLRQRKAELAQTAFEEALRGDPRLSKANANLAISLLLQFRDAATRAIASNDVPESNREALQALLRHVDRTLALPGPAGVK